LAVGHCTYRVEARSDQEIHHSTYLKLDSDDSGFADVLSLISVIPSGRCAASEASLVRAFHSFFKYL